MNVVVRASHRWICGRSISVGVDFDRVPAFSHLVEHDVVGHRVSRIRSSIAFSVLPGPSFVLSSFILKIYQVLLVGALTGGTRLTRGGYVDRDDDLLRFFSINIPILQLSRARESLLPEVRNLPVFVVKDCHSCESFLENVPRHLEFAIIFLVAPGSMVRFTGPGVADNDPSGRLIDSEDRVSMTVDKSVLGDPARTGHHVAVLVTVLDEIPGNLIVSKGLSRHAGHGS